MNRGANRVKNQYFFKYFSIVLVLDFCGLLVLRMALVVRGEHISYYYSR